MKRDLVAINKLLEEIIQENIAYKMMAKEIMLSETDLQELLNTIIAHDCDSVYDSLSIDDHELIWKKQRVEAHYAYDYGYVDILNLHPKQFEYIQNKIKPNNERGE